MKILSPAKINLFLEVLGKRKDGYHEIRTLFERISLCDEIILKSKKSGISVECDSDKIPKGPKNLACRAAKLLKDRFKIKTGVHIKIKKRIPVAAGLGGGSSNAAAVLLGLNRMWALGLKEAQLVELASCIGSDCAFFVLQTSFALGAGRGEKLKKVKPPSRKIWHVLVKPDFGISTKQAYHALKPYSLTPPRHMKAGLTPQNTDVKMLFRSIENGDSTVLSRLLSNTLELTLNKRLTSISGMKNELMKRGALAALMSGSGSSVFGVFRTKRLAEKAAARLKVKNGWEVFVVGTF